LVDSLIEILADMPLHKHIGSVQVWTSHRADNFKVDTSHVATIW